MPNLSRYPTPIQQYFVTPHVKTGDYYLVMNPHSGRRTWVYPRKMGEDRYAVVSALGEEPAAQQFNVQSWLNSLVSSPSNLVNELTSARADLARYQTLTKLAIGASVVASSLVLIMFWRNR